MTARAEPSSPVRRIPGAAAVRRVGAALAETGGALRAAEAGRGRELLALHDAVTTPLPLRRRIGVIAVRGGSGASTVATELSLVLSARRREPVLVVKAQGISPSPLDQLARDGSRRGSPAGAVGLVARRLDASAWPADIAAWERFVGDEQRRHELTVTDWGMAPQGRIADLAVHSHAVCLVAAADLEEVRRAHDLAVALAPYAPAVIAVNDPHRTAGPALADVVRRLTVPAVMLGHDIRRPRAIELPPHPRRRDSLALLRLAAALVTEVARPRRKAVDA